MRNAVVFSSSFLHALCAPPHHAGALPLASFSPQSAFLEVKRNASKNLKR